VSIGAVTCMMAPDDVQALVQMADSVMYSAKKDGKNRVYVEVIGRDTAMANFRPSADAQVQGT